MNPVDKILEARNGIYGDFQFNAQMSQRMKRVFRDHARFQRLEADQQEALDMIAFKISRILTGDPNYVDNWVDIAGYAQLVVNRLEKA